MNIESDKDKHKHKHNNQLKLMDDFQTVLSKYHPSQSTINTLESTNPIFLVGTTASGRNTLINILVRNHDYYYMVSDTTRKPRVNNGVLERNGVEYWFIQEEDFLSGLKNGEYIEAAIIHNQQVSGISVRELEKAKLSNKRTISEIEVEGAKTIHEFINNGLFIFLLPPSFDIWMDRLVKRGQVENAELNRRLLSAEKEIEDALESNYYHFVINNDIGEAAEAVHELANGRIPDIEKQKSGIDRAEQLVESIKLYLKNL